MRIKQALAAIAFAALAIPAQAAFIIGSISIVDGIDPASLPGAGSSSVVSALTSITHDPAGSGIPFGCTGTFGILFENSCGGGNTGTMTDWTFAGPFPVDVITIDGFTFHLQGVTLIDPVGLVCNANGACNDKLTLSIFGTVDGNGYQLSGFSGSLALTGGCVGNNVGGAHCTGLLTAGYTYSLAATGNPEVPEPATLALLGIGLAGLGFARRRKQS